MDIRCERCATEYELEDARVAAGGVTIKCSTCGHVFKVVKTAPPDDNSCQLRLYRGGAPLLATCPDPATLQQWIIESRVLRDDEISFGNGPWQHLWQVPELVPFFALLSAPPLARGTPAAGVAPYAPPPPAAPPPPVQAVPSTGTNPFSTPAAKPAAWGAVAPPPASPPLPTLRLGSVESQESADFAATVQVQVTPEMFDALRAPPPNHTSQAPAPWTPFAPTSSDGVPAPAPTVVAEPPVPLPGPTPNTSYAPKTAVPAQASSAPAASSPAAAPGPVRTPLKTPVVAKSKPPPARKAPDPDPEISAFVKRRRNRAFVFVTVILVLGVLGVAYYEFGDSGPSPAAKHAYEEGRKAYLLDTEKQLVLAEKELKKAAGKEPGSYPDANGALAELYMVWAEHYRDAYDLLSAEVKTKAESGNTDEAKKLNDKAKAVSAEVKKKLDAAQEQLNALKAIETSSLAADRAALDYARLVNDAKQANAAVETLKPQTDPETQAHVAAWLATDPAQRGTAETSLTDAIQNEPNFIRARWWLASLHIALGNTAAATSDLQALLKLAPGHEEAAEALKKLQQAAQPVTAVASDNGSNGTPAPATPETKPKEAASEKGSTAESGTATPEKKDRHAKEPRKGSDESASSSAPMDPDKLIDQAGHLLDKGKPAAALEVYDRVLAVKPTLTDALYGKGVALYNMGRTTDAITAFLKTLEVNARFSDAIIGVAEAYKKNHDNKSAVKYYEKYLDVFPGGPQAGAARANIRALSSP